MLWISLIQWGSSKEAHIFWASSWRLPTSGIFPSSHHQLGISTACPLHSTHLSYSSAGASEGKLLPSSSLDLLADSPKKCLTSGPSSGGSPRLNSRKASSACLSSHWGGLCVGEWPSSCRAQWCLLLCPQDLLLHQSQRWEWAWASTRPQVMDRFSLSIFSFSTMVVARALQWASLASVSSFLAEMPLLPLHGVFLHARQLSASSNSLQPLAGSSSFCLRWFFKEDTTSLVCSPACSSLHGRDLGNCLSLYTW